MLVKGNMFSVGEHFIGIVIWADFCVFLGHVCFGEMLGAEVVIEVVVEVVVGKVDFFYFVRCDCLRKMMGPRVVIEVVFEVVVLV